MLEPLVATFSLSDTFPQRLNRQAFANFPAVLKGVSNYLRHTVDANRYAINSRVDHALGQSTA
jgi:hypothetical protein